MSITIYENTINPFIPNALFLYPLKTSEHLTVPGLVLYLTVVFVFVIEIQLVAFSYKTRSVGNAFLIWVTVPLNLITQNVCVITLRC